MGEPVPEETFTHSHPSWSSNIPVCLIHLLRPMASSLFTWQSRTGRRRRTGTRWTRSLRHRYCCDAANLCWRTGISMRRGCCDVDTHVMQRDVVGVCVRVGHGRVWSILLQCDRTSPAYRYASHPVILPELRPLSQSSS